MAFEVEGKDVADLKHEGGGHRIQRVPPTERSGRIHTSTVTVAVLDGAAAARPERPESDFKIEWYAGTGNGGQYRNKHQNCARVTHVLTGMVQTAGGRHREVNLRDALAELNRRLDAAQGARQAAVANITRQDQVGTGMRGDKRRTYRFQEGRVVDHVTGRAAPTSAVMRGGFEALWA